jgi:hypothetical protein
MEALTWADEADLKADSSSALFRRAILRIDRQRQEVVERLCRTLEQEYWQVVRDKTTHALYQNARQEKQEFLNDIISLVLDDARFGTPRGVEYAK